MGLDRHMLSLVTASEEDEKRLTIPQGCLIMS